jgi:pteridine reductase
MVDENYPLALVTGAADRLGKAFALSLAREGFAIQLHYHLSAKKVDQTTAEIKAIGVPVYQFSADLTDETEIQSLFSHIDTLPYKLKVVVNSAAIMQKSDARELSINDWDVTLDLNLRAPFIIAQEAVKRMMSGGQIINIIDIGAQKVWTRYPAYVASKSALETLTRVLAKAYAPKIRVNALAPGLVLPADNIQPAEWKALVERTPLQRPVSLAEVVSALDYLVTNEAVTGQVVVVDGGYSLI